jgi:hypothetical protein
VSALELYRDDGLLAPLLRGRLEEHPLRWLVPPLVRAVEYGSLIALTQLSAPERMPYCFALLAALAFHHYDAAYRLRLQGSPPPAWVALVGGGWEIRVALAGVLALAGGLGTGLLVAAVVLGAVWLAESTASWARFARAGRTPESLGEGVE